MEYNLYLLKHTIHNKTYLGITNNLKRRLRQHNCEIKGGAKYTTRKGRNWYPICIIDGFKTMKEAMQCEWRLKRNRKYRGCLKRIEYVYLMLQNEKWTTKSPLIKEQNLTIYIDDDYSYLFNNYPTKQLYWK